MSFNIRGDFDGGEATDKPEAWISTSGAHRRDLVLRLIVDYDPDLLGVQEAYANQLAEIDAALPGHDFYAVGRDDGERAGEHCAIYYRRDRFDRMNARTFWLSEDTTRPSRYPGAACNRVASWVMFRDFDRGYSELLVMNTHWDHVSAEAREHSARLVRRWFDNSRQTHRTIVMGDLNADEKAASLRVLTGDGALTDSYRARHPKRGKRELTYHGFEGGAAGARIDFILHNDRLRAADAAIVRTKLDGRFPSDHYPVTATLVEPR